MSALTLRGVGKYYRLGERQPYGSLRDAIRRVASARSTRAENPTGIWALRGITFDVECGEVLGVIGRNGAGKSTLLKILARVTEPTEGRGEIRGRVGSLLEVGTGFHPELTGRENIFLNGAILGMRTAEIRSRLDEIVAFAEIERFIETPVKRYSSGMALRLGFAVAAHLEADVLLMDEILAVGDAAFQKKCLGTMAALRGSGRTIIFVSHQIGAVQSLCTRVICLADGRIVADGDPTSVVTGYLATDAASTEWRPSPDSRTANPYFTPTRFAVGSEGGLLGINDEIVVTIEGESQEVSQALTVGFALHAGSGELLFWSLHTDGDPSEWPVIRRGWNRLRARIPAHLLNEGEYYIELIVSLHNQEWLVRPGLNAPVVGFEVRGGFGSSPHWLAARPGLIAPVCRFEAE